MVYLLHGLLAQEPWEGGINSGTIFGVVKKPLRGGDDARGASASFTPLPWDQILCSILEMFDMLGLFSPIYKERVGLYFGKLQEFVGPV